MKFEIKHRITGSLLFSIETENWKLCLEAAVKSAANLDGANLGGANLGGANLGGANLRGANLDGANLRGANLGGANLDGANLGGANLRGANLRGANLDGANLGGANLDGANLGGANLRAANLGGANLDGANLGGANLGGANLDGANLGGANLGGANLGGANLDGAKNAELSLARLSILPAGALVGWKKLRDGIIARLHIPHDARRVHAYSSRKCRAEFAYVTGMCKDDVPVTEGFSSHCSTFKYTHGQIVTPAAFDMSRQEECSAGIHFFITREEAEAYS